jgi:RIO-like serine/threonine protein kinase
MTPEVEQQVLSAYEKIHALGIVHDRPKPGNILVANGKVWIIDFERSTRYAILAEGKKYIDYEQRDLLRLLADIKERKTHIITS